VFARTTLLEIDTLRAAVDDVLARFEADVIPRLRQQDGFAGVYALTTPEGKAMLITFWDTADQADAHTESGWYPSVLSEFTTVFKSPPGRDHYEVRFAMPPMTVGATR
jgi:hypothetical protein